ncbi:Aminoglycoside phosphotransferase OS=Tsukamurella paurometabola (strain ATCC 8368 / DSM / CCUG 35730 / CIP 100753 / JCM 10117 / KCTC 9821 / NBRC 16120 /NCIMB 702349 / NCTC 13040) OX=521096 GN=Tpau_3867 PE=4 SV=1 [Tsukamurella paurometabola]|uniref:Aminoglycoside phosphotransferase n=1 Tax=Tsukamurella paurometabola (strain ATCC 8368 / DSM 20162 / CCUG 35730 / CIP 100753 / JCM 10117 / KCTC 9821 / NBRC 16120 / NCIMB 702349 / NCTC 13040) TaxID=521096 RepID=D5UMG8_TSUPD|nr:phosphotransferase [Tsukamurella paurometabola]ADG80442.1 aminoglycoside phosphotransferase [Tsukamurella paurometabola DSM 20162]SUP39655.1 Phosphotransferase enzyme family [Tsukamurella paurometabola]
MDGHDEPLVGGNSAAHVIRRGDTVRKPWTDSTPSVVRYLRALSTNGVTVPRHLGRDSAGRQRIAYVPGRLAHHHRTLSDHRLIDVGRAIRRIHDASESIPFNNDHWDVLIPSPAPSTLLCHNDIAPWNLVINGNVLSFIDWDGAGPSTRTWDLAYAAQSFARMDPSSPPVAAAQRLRSLLLGYQPDAAMSRELPDVIAHRTRAMFDTLRDASHTRREPWAGMFASGHGEYWSAAADYVEQHAAVWAEAIAYGHSTARNSTGRTT